MRFIINPFTKRFDAVDSTGSVPPSVATTYTADDATTATPVANNLNVFSDDSTANNNNGVRTTAAGDTLTVQLTNRLQDETSTVGAVTADAVTFALGASPGVFTFDINISAFESATPLGSGYKIFGTVRTTGAAATLIGTPDKVVHEEGALSAANADLVISGNNAIIRVTGVVALTINWGTTATYVYRGA